MALHRGIQSAIFYYVSCAPCAEVRVRKRRKQEAERDRAEREAIEAHMPGLYRQPDPSSTNPYWQTEIDAGPIPMRTKKRIAESNKAANSTRSNIASSISVDASARSMERSDSAKSGLEQFQRQDEALWGSSYHDSGHLRPSSATRSSGLPKQLPRAVVNDQPHLRSYQYMQNAAVNDLHPPTTRKIISKEEVSWMMQPPPLPDIMNGKQAVRNRSVSNASRPSVVSSRSRRPQSEEAESEQDEEMNSKQQHPPAGFATLQVPEQALAPVHRSKTLPIRHPQDDARSKNDLPRKPPPLQSEPVSPNSIRKLSRPQLPTVLSESLTFGLHDSPENDNPRLPHNGQLDSAGGRAGSSTNAAQYKWLATRVVVPHRDSLDGHGSDSNASPENFDAWQAPEFELPQWIHEHTKREVRQRWSFDM